VLVAAEGGLCRFLVFAGVAGKFQLEGAELVVDDLPDDFVGGHGGLCVVRLLARRELCVILVFESLMRLASLRCAIRVEVTSIVVDMCRAAFGEMLFSGKGSEKKVWRQIWLC